MATPSTTPRTTQRSTFDIDAALRRLARPQLGLVTTAQTRHEGIDHAAIHRRRTSGALEPIFAGVFRLGASTATSEQRTLAAALAVPGSCVAASSAGAVIGMPVASRPEPIVAVGDGRSSRTSGVRVVRQRTPLPSRPWYTARVATPEATLVLLPRFEDGATVERCLDHCLAHRLTTVGRVRDLLETMPPRAVVGRPLLLELLDARSTGIGHRSGLEQRVGRWLDAEGLTGWQRNLGVALAGGGSIEVDFAWPDARVALELSPFFTHGSRDAQARDVERRRLLIAEGWTTVEVGDDDLTDREAFHTCIEVIRAVVQPTSRALPFVQRTTVHTKRPAA
ncbi:MAG: type IV toxin-antitoxin system AbiEi family antitoxin domain-containing protein [Acidimicrobiales bacterium]